MVNNVINSFESWFNRRFGWFFTNGSKHGQS